MEENHNWMKSLRILVHKIKVKKVGVALVELCSNEELETVR